MRALELSVMCLLASVAHADRAPRFQDVEPVVAPPVRASAATTPFCQTQINEVMKNPGADTIEALVDTGRLIGGDCRIAADDIAEQFARAAGRFIAYFPTISVAKMWAVASQAATTRARRDAAFRNGVAYTWKAAEMYVWHAAPNGDPFPIDPWIDAAEASLAAYQNEPYDSALATLALDAYENAMRASRDEGLTPEQTTRIVTQLDAIALPGGAASISARARALRATWFR